MNNRFFYRCPRCLFRFTVDAATLRQPHVAGCACCQAERVDCLGATRGVLSMRVPCDARCTFATGNSCTCSCGGRNHGAGILVPVLSGVADLSHYPAQELASIRREFAAFKAGLAEVAAALPEALQDALAASQAGAWLPRADWEAAREYKFARLHAWQSMTWAGRRARLQSLRALYAPQTLQITPAAPAAGQLLLF